MKRIHDERLIVRNLKNIRIAFGIENIVIILILLWQSYLHKNWSGVFSLDNPLFAVLMIGAFILIVLSVNISSPTEDKPKASIKLITIRFVIELIVLSFVFYILLKGSHFLVSLIAGTVIALVLLEIDLYANHFRE